MWGGDTEGKLLCETQTPFRLKKSSKYIIWRPSGGDMGRFWSDLGNIKSLCKTRFNLSSYNGVDFSVCLAAIDSITNQVPAQVFSKSIPETNTTRLYSQKVTKNL